MNTQTSLLGEFKKLPKLWPYLRASKGRVYLAIFLMPLILVAHSGVPFVLKSTIDEGILLKDPDRILLGAGIFLLLVILEYTLKTSQTILLALSVHKMISRLRNTLIRHVLALSPSYHDRSLSGALVTRATSDFDNMSESLNQAVISAALDIALITGAIAGMFILDWRLALSVVVVLPFVSLIVTWFSKALKKTMLHARVKIARLNAFTQECLYGISTVKLLGAETQASQKVSTQAIDYRNAQMKSVVLDAFMFALLDGISSISIGVFLWFAARSLSLDTGAISAGVVVGFVAFIVRLYDPLKQLGQKIAMLQGAFTSIDRIFSILETKDFIHGKKKIETMKGKVTFQKVTFSYDKTQKPILKNVDFHIKEGESLAIVGPTGSGKSTIIKLLSKMYAGFDGDILIDDTSIKELDPENLRSKMAIVPQDITLFEGSIAFNISLGLKEISRQDVQQAAKIVGAHDFIMALPNTYDFELTSMGANLSQGQRQLLAFARALVRKPALVILDEATSSVDPKSEAAIQGAISKMLADRTVIIIAHRLTTIAHCNQILVLKDGEVTEQGGHQDLLDLKGVYAQMQADLH